jgi:OmpA-OmpF porin, OOP family
MQRSKLPYYFLGLAALIALSAILILISRPGVFSKVPAAAPALLETPETNNDSKPVTPRNPLPSRATVATATDSASLVAQIAQALEAGDLAKLMRLIGKDALDSENRGRLTALSANPLRLRQPNGIREVGEIELNARSRWVLELDGPPPGRDQIFLDLRRQNGKWAVQKITFPPGADEPIPKAISADSLDVADAFLQSILKQDFERARAFVDPATVSDIASCLKMPNTDSANPSRSEPCFSVTIPPAISRMWKLATENKVLNSLSP